MKTFEQFAAEERENVRSGMLHYLTVVVPNQLAPVERVKASAGGKILRRRSYTIADPVAVERLAERVRAELADIEGTLRKMYATECEFKRTGRPSLV
jgi:hypothetical protein